MAKKEKYIDDYIKEGDDIGALRYLAKELYTSFKIGGTRKCLLDRVADRLERLTKENERLLAKNNKLIDKYDEAVDLGGINSDR